MSNAIAEVGEFFTGWTTYRQVLDNNYMFHKEIYQAVNILLNEQLVDQPFSLLDLGCGDASFLAMALQGTTIREYTGYDLSASALILAEKNLAPLESVVHLFNEDLLAGLEKTEECFDVIFTSFAVHHLNIEEKANFFSLAKSALTDNGFLLFIDVMREPTESLDTYLDNYCFWLEDTWVCLESEERAALAKHIRNNDMPETANTLCALAKTAGFNHVKEVCQFPWHRAFIFYV
jgi:cyclopropane fatty-acyl-phospholipid synthase-like methyltransferase